METEIGENVALGNCGRSSCVLIFSWGRWKSEEIFLIDFDRDLKNFYTVWRLKLEETLFQWTVTRRNEIISFRYKKYENCRENCFIGLQIEI